MSEYVIEMLGITKRFKGIVANDNVTLRLRKGEIHALLGENGAGKSTLMSVLFGLYQPEEGEIKKDGVTVDIKNPNDANKLKIGMVHQHFKLVHNFTVLENIVLGTETVKGITLDMTEAREKVIELSKKFQLHVEPDALISDITVGMQQRVEILKMLYRENEILIFDEPTAVLTPAEIEELLSIMQNLVEEGRSILFITHKLNEIKEVADRCSVLRKGKYIATVEVADTSKEELSELMVGHKVNFSVDKTDSVPTDVVLSVKKLNLKGKNATKSQLTDVSFTVRRGEIVCIAGIDGNGQSELVYALTGLMKATSGEIFLNGKNISNLTVRDRNETGMSHIPEDRHKHGLVLDYTVEKNLVLKNYYKEQFQKGGFIKFPAVSEYADMLIERFDVRSGEGARSMARSLSGGNQQKAIIAREIAENKDLLIAVQPTRGLDVGAIEYIHSQLVAQRDSGKAVLLISLELDEVMDVSDRIIVMYEGELVGELNPKEITVSELGLYMSGSKRGAVSE